LKQTIDSGSSNNNLTQASSGQLVSADLRVDDGDSTKTKSSDEVNMVFISSSEERLDREYEERRKKLVKRKESKVKTKNENEILWPNPYVFPVHEMSSKLFDKLKNPKSFINELEYNQITSILLDKMLLLNR